MAGRLKIKRREIHLMQELITHMGIDIGIGIDVE
tara:strand:- start:143 stop:244 length:102 start_codon:yes stop_codon:yes gene_type:complete